MGVELVGRKPNGHFIPGTPSANPTGVNQWSPEQALKRRLSKEIERQILKKPACIVTHAEAVVRALEDPTEGRNLELLKMHLPKDAIIELRTDGARLAQSSQELWDGLAEEFGSEECEDAQVVSGPPDADPEQGAD